VMLRTLFLLLAASIVALVAAAAPARAGTFEVSPLVVMLHRGVSSQTITVSNNSAETLRLQVTGLAWAQSADGRELTNPTDDLVFFPTLLDIPAGTRRVVRIGLASRPADDAERTYRVYLLQLPSVASQIGGAMNTAGLDMRVQLSVPVFVAASHAQAKPNLAFTGVNGGHLGLRLENRGTAHLLAHTVEVEGVDGHGTRLFSRSLKGWYVLANGERDYDVALEPQECGKLRALHVVAQTDSGTVTRDFSQVDGTCR
jgi:fimbrial chaperone protein